MIRLSARLLVGAAVVVSGLLALEGLSYLFGRFPLGFDPLITHPQPTRNAEREFDRLLFWRMKPGFRDGAVEINRLGFRGPEIPERKPDREFRLLSLGESTTFARTLSYPESYSALLETQLQTAKGKTLRVINAGAPGYTLFQGFTLFRYRSEPLGIDAVMVYFGYNDFLPVSFLAERGGGPEASAGGLTDRELFEQRCSALWRIRYELLSHSNLLRGLGTLIRPSSAPENVRSDQRRVRVPAEDRQRSLDELLGLCRQRHVDLVIVVPWYREFEQHAPLLREFAATHGVLLVDLPERLRGLPKSRPEYFADSVHPTALGHREMARVMAEVLAKHWQ